MFGGCAHGKMRIRMNSGLAFEIGRPEIGTVGRDFLHRLPEALRLMSHKSTPDKTFAFITLGCPKNLVDSERMLGKLAQDGYALVPQADGADVVVVNTCGFIEPARQESLGGIREMLALKEQGQG